MMIGNNVRIANGFSQVVASFDEITIKNDCLFVEIVMIINGNNGYKNIYKSIMLLESYSTAPIRTGNGSWIERGSSVMGGVTFGQNTVVGANTVVTNSVPDFSAITGNPDTKKCII